MEQNPQHLTAVVQQGQHISPLIAAPSMVAFSHTRVNGIVRACIVASCPENGIWIYLSNMLYSSIQHEVYARLSGVEYEEYLEMQDYADARYPEPSSQDLRTFFARFMGEFMPIEDIKAPKNPTATATALPDVAGRSNATPIGYVITK